MKAVIFDIGRVLVHWNPHAVVHGIAQISRAPEAEIEALLHEISHEIGTGRMGAQAFHQHLVERAGTDDRWDTFYQAYCSGLARDEIGLSYAGDLWQRGVPVGVVSNTNAIHVEWLREQVPEFSRWQPVIYSSDVGLLKPDPAIYRLVMERVGIAPQDALFVDDLEENVAGAQAIGMAGAVHQDWASTRRVVENWLLEKEGLNSLFRGCRNSG